MKHPPNPVRSTRTLAEIIEELCSRAWIGECHLELLVSAAVSGLPAPAEHVTTAGNHLQLLAFERFCPCPARGSCLSPGAVDHASNGS